MSDRPNPDRFRLVQELFDAALDLPPEQRLTFLANKCGDDKLLIEEVASLLDADREPTWTASDTTAAWATSRSLSPGTHIGAFTIVKSIGEGGMGSVYEATQDRPQRTVALKTLRAGSDSPKARRRFEYESEILGRLQHPGIAQIYEAGTYREGDLDVPFLAMELLIDARDIDTFIQAEKLAPAQVLSLFADVCDAVQHAHQHGIVHRDLKPTNLMVDQDGRVKVIDFGIASTIDTDEVRRTMRTDTGVLLGTLAYMSPEQLDPHSSSPDARTDIYSLGVLLFQLLTGRLPHDVNTLPIPTAITVIAERDVPRLRTYGVRRCTSIARELDWILQKATDRDRNHRYQTVAELAADVRRFLADRPVEVGPPSTAYRLRKFVPRHRAAVAGGVMAGVALLGGTVATAIGWHRAVQAESITTQKRAELEQVTFGFWQTTQMTDRIDQIKSGGIQPEVLQQLDRIAVQLDSQSIERPSIEAALRVKLARTFSEFGVRAAAMHQYERALALVAGDTESMPEVHIQALTQYGTMLVTAGKVERAITLLQQATELAQTHANVLADPPALPRSRMAYALHQLGRFAEARDAYDAVLSELEALSVPYPTLRFQALLGRGNARRALGEREPALADLQAALQHGERTLGTNDHRTLGARVDLAIALLADKRCAPAAEQLLRAVTEVRSKTLGATHTQTIAAVLNLAFALHRQDKFAESEILCRHYLDAAQLAGVATSVPLMKLRFNLGVAQMQRDPPRIAAAEGTFRCLVADAQTALASDHWMTMAFHARVGMCRSLTALATNDDTIRRTTILKEACQELELAVAGLERKLGTKNRQTIEAVRALAKVYDAQGQQQPASELRERFAIQH